MEEYNDIPEQMATSKRWLLWKSIPHEVEGKKNKKVPFYTSGQRRNGQLDSDADRNNLVTLKEAYQMLYAGDYSGLGFALGADGTGNYWQGIDLDGLSKHPELGYIQEELPGYTELSPSGDGWHSIGYGRKFDALGSNETGIEAYSHGRYFTVTGECAGIGNPCCIADYIENVLRPIHSRGIKKPEQVNQEITKVTDKTISELRSALLSMRADDRELWQKNGHRLKGLGDVGRGLWLEWSATSEKYDPQSDSKTWDSFKPTHTGYKAVFSEAQALGWLNPSKRIDEPSEPIEDDAWVTATELSEQATAPNYLINNIIESKTHGLLSGASQAFKSFCVLKIAHSICTGTDFFGHCVYETGKVLYICGEGMGALGRRIRAINIVEGAIGDNLIIKKKPLSIDNLAEMDWLRNQINEIHPVLVIFDTFSSLATSTVENSNEEVARTLRIVKDACSDNGTSSIIVHHFGKDAEKGSRGASAFKANVDFEMSMKRDMNFPLSATLTCVKSKDGDYFEDVLIKAHVVDIGLVRQDGSMASSLVLKPTNCLLGPRQDKALKSMEKLILEHGYLSDGILGIDETALRKRFIEDFKESLSNPYKVFAETIPELKEKKVIAEKEGFFWVL